MTDCPDGFEPHLGTVWACVVCGALVEITRTKDHRRWHGTL